ncbi:unnamed protein product, partial [marine sediment metagenome]
IAFTIFSDRKYFWSGFFSSMSDNEHPLPILGNTEILAVKHLPLTVIPKLIQRSDNGFKGSPIIVAKESFDILKE